MIRIAATCFFILSVAASAAGATRRGQLATSLPESFVIGLHAAADIEDADFLRAAEAGFTLVLPLRPSGDYSTHLLAACEAAKLQAVVWDPRMATHGLSGWEAYGPALREYSKSRALVGYVITDYLPVPPSRVTSLWFRNREIGGADRRRFRYAESLHLDDFSSERAFEQYLGNFLGTGIGYLVYEETSPFSSAALKTMTAVAKIARQRRATWWRRCTLAEPTPAMVRWQSYSAAAAGATGVISLVMRPVPTLRHDSLLNADGTPSAVFDAATAVNNRLKAVGPILMAADPDFFYTTGTVPEGAPRPPAKSPLVKITSSEDDDGFLIAGFSADEGQYLFVVRKPSAGAEAASITLQFADGTTATVVETNAEYVGTLQLLPGEGQLLLVK